MKNDPTSNASGLTRRAWLQKVSMPALAVAGASTLPTVAQAASAHSKGDQPGLFNIRHYGARGDGSTNDTQAVQRTIDACHQQRGGIVLVPAGDYLCGTLELKSNVTLHLAVSGRLLGSPRREDYQAPAAIPPGNGNVVFIYAANADNISIEGPGTIDGDGIHFNNGKGDNTGPGGSIKTGNFDRPHLVIFYRCRHIRIEDSFFTRSAYHCFRILECQQINIHGIRIYNRVNRNNDGFHFNSSQYIHISDCDVACQDDGCALFGSNQFVTVNNCTFSTRWSIFRFGAGEAKNITVSNCIIYDTYGCPIKIGAGKSRIENLLFSNIVMEHVTGPIGIGFNAGDNNDTFVRNISFHHIRASLVPKPVNHPDIPFDVKPFDGEQNSCITLNGVGNSYLEDISFNDVQVIAAGGGTAAQAAKEVPAVSAEYFGVWGTAPVGAVAYGLYARNVKGLTLQHVRLTYRETDVRPAVVLDHVSDAAILSLSIQGHPEATALRFINCRDILCTATRLLSPAAVFLQAEGDQCSNIIIEGGDHHKAKQTTLGKLEAIIIK
ncbi:glycoside hydrolase family 28 protein [Chitinophaga qingshengii]|uniref:Right-handed parallel beta-helix repeat-containing protein n=1 Tax=Chitinophaga qingshengii TaxID=1569794 RepID=A0ABR7TRZ1_9BACT|nr:glycosyl hydrolase family 28 protein [Chitinophaga qingshengii]MBC9933259.1 right-handed parallel beta-helix repeat-containing protein [Chitinophaga qingshengii]